MRRRLAALAVVLIPLLQACGDNVGVVRADGVLAEVSLWVMNNPRPYLMEPERVAEILRDSIRKVGIRVRIQKFDWATYLAKLQRGEHQLALIGWSTDNGDPDNFFTPILSKASIGGPNYSRMQDPEFERLLAASRGCGDSARREAMFAHMHEVIRRVCPSVPLVSTQIASAFRADVRGFLRHPIKLRLAGVRREAGNQILVYGRGKDSLTLDPAAAHDGESTKIIDNVYETLVDFADDRRHPSRIVPCLAVRWRLAPDRKSCEFELRRGVRFHDGTPLDAAACKLSLDRLIQPDHELAPGKRPYAINYQDVEAVDVVDPHRLRIRLRRPSVLLLPNLAMFCASIVSSKALRERGEGIATRPVGTGPFRFSSWRPDVNIVLERNDAWWREQRAGLRTIVFQQVKDWAGRRERLKAGEIQMTDDVVFQDIRALARTPGIEVEVCDGMNLCYLAMNNEKAPFDDIRVRLAVAKAVDRERIVRLGYYGHAKPATGFLPDTVPGHRDGVFPDHDTSGARRLLEEALTR